MAAEQAAGSASVPAECSRAGRDHVFAHQYAAAAIGILQQHQAQQAGQNHDERNRHLEKRADDGRHARGAQVVRRQHALHHQEVRGPVAEADHEAQAEDDAGPVHAHGVGGRNCPVSRHR